jgi:hypothetical protein
MVSVAPDEREKNRSPDPSVGLPGPNQ